MKLVLIDNIGSHYRTAIFRLMDKELDCDFCFGDKVDDIKKMDYSLLKHKVTEVHNVQLGHGFYWQKGVCSLLRKDYDHYLTVGETRCLSTWWMCILARLFYPRKKMYFWTHGWYGKETLIERFLKKVFLRLPKGGVFTYGNYARELMIEEGFNPAKINVIHNSLDYEHQVEIRKSLSVNPIFKKHFGNGNPDLFFIGRLTPVKQLDMVLQAIALLRDRGEMYNMTFIGDGSQRASLESLTKELCLEKQVWFYGACYDETLLGDMIYNADLCVAPGNIGLTAMHTMVFGTPAITHDDFPHQMPEFEAIHEGETGTFFKRGSVDSLADGISRWFTDKRESREEVRSACMHEIDTQWTPQFQIEVLKQELK